VLTGQIDTSSMAFTPLAPRSLDESGLSMGLLSDLALKIFYFESYISGRDLALRMGLPFPNIVSVVLEFLRREQLCEIRSATGRGGFSESTYEYVLTSRGRDMARAAGRLCGGGTAAGPERRCHPPASASPRSLSPGV